MKDEKCCSGRQQKGVLVGVWVKRKLIVQSSKFEVLSSKNLRRECYDA